MQKLTLGLTLNIIAKPTKIMFATNSEYASVIISKCLNIRSDEEVVIFTDRSKLDFSDDLAYSIKKCGGKVSVFFIPGSIRPVSRINDAHSVSLIIADAVIYILETQSELIDLSKEEAFRHYLLTLPLQHKGRVCMMPGFSEEMKGAVSIDYEDLDRKCKCLKSIIENKTLRIKTDLGTDVKFSLQGREIKIDNGDLSKPGSFGNLPAGEIFTAPIEETMSGKIVVDGSIGGLGVIKHPFTIEVEAGQIKDVQSEASRDEIFDKYLKIIEYDLPATRTVGEFGIGLNPDATLMGNMLMDEKVEGTIHFAFGDSYGLGKSVSKFHTDVLIRKPTIFIENKCIMDKGKFTVF